MARDAKLITVFAVLAMLCAGVVVRQVAFEAPPEVAAIRQHVDVGSDDVLSIEFMGDTMLGDAALSTLKRHGYGYPFSPELIGALDGDYIIANLETPVTSRSVPYNPGSSTRTTPTRERSER